MLELDHLRSYEYVEFDEWLDSRMDMLPGELPIEIADQVGKFSNNGTFDQLKYKYSEACMHEYKHFDQLKNLLMTRNILGEQLVYLYDKHFKLPCDAWFICHTLNGRPLDMIGGIFAFWNYNEGKTLFIQAITRFLVPSLIANFLPQNKFPHLNQVLEPTIESLAKQLKAKRILVVPVGDKQVDILTKYYGYKPSSDLYYPCEIISGYDSYINEPSTLFNNVYEKLL